MKARTRAREDRFDVEGLFLICRSEAFGRGGDADATADTLLCSLVVPRIVDVRLLCMIVVLAVWSCEFILSVLCRLGRAGGLV